jgi:hypothetical protein
MELLIALIAVAIVALLGAAAVLYGVDSRDSTIRSNKNVSV